MHTKRLPLIALLLGCAALGACAKKEAAAPAPATAASPAPVAAAAPQPAASPIDTTGLPPACAEYVKRYLACTLKLPATEAAELNTRLASAVASMHSAPNSPDLPRHCFNLNEEMRDTPAMKDC